MPDPSVVLPVYGQIELNNLKNSLLADNRDRIDEYFSIKKSNGSILNVSSNIELTLALSAAQRGANDWMICNGNEEMYRKVREDYMVYTDLLKARYALSLNPAAIAVIDSQRNNYDRGAATARGMGLNRRYTIGSNPSNHTDNLPAANRALVVNVMEGFFFNTSNQQLTPFLGSGMLQAKGYAAAQQERRARASVRVR